MHTINTESSIKWIRAVSRDHTPLFIDLFYKGQSRDIVLRNTGLDLEFFNIKKDGLDLFVDAKEMADNEARVRRAFQGTGLTVLSDYAARCLSSCESLLSLSRSISAIPYDDTSNPLALLSTLERYTLAVVSHSTFLLPILFLQKLLEEELLALGERYKSATHADDDDVKRLLAAMQFTTHEVLEPQNLLDLLHIGADVQANKDLRAVYTQLAPEELLAVLPVEFSQHWEDISQFKDHYGWSGRMYYAGSALSEWTIIVRIQNVLKKNCAREIARIAKQHKDAIAARTQAIELFSTVSPDNAPQLAEIADRFLFLRSYRLDVFFIAHDNIQNLLHAIADIMGIEPEELAFLILDEIRTALQTSQTEPDVKVLIDARQTGFSAVMLNGVVQWSVVEQQQRKRMPSATDIIKGVVANPGRAKGPARVIVRQSTIATMQDGEVLVTTMTTPSLMFAVERAAAIVTDEGGMLCHAAIISRELNIPCIIATERATRLIHTGQIIEVNATEGLVRLLTKL